ncbi:hypothetical protein ACFR99_16375 [Haloarchaeobius amylolyticus]|uniref:Secreted protein n=1 Tax=Haloarchaeobius amylolyticus TaxID=1198296 RepID=A0ABD6BKA5_9EURY
MQRRTLLTIAIGLSLLVGTMGTVTAQPADGPPDDLPEPVPEFVSDILETISDFVSGALESLGEAVRTLAPGGDTVESSGGG